MTKENMTSRCVRYMSGTVAIHETYETRGGLLVGTQPVTLRADSVAELAALIVEVTPALGLPVLVLEEASLGQYWWHLVNP